MMASCASCGQRHKVENIDGKLVAEPCKDKESRVNPRGQPSGEVAKPTGHDRSRDSATSGGAVSNNAQATKMPASKGAVRTPAAPPTSRSRYRATPTHVDGIRFASRGEAALYVKAKAEGWVVVPHVRFPLHVLHTEGMAATWFSPDLLLISGPGKECYVAVWEFKGPKFLESRDYALRAKAFRATYPSIPLRTFRKVKGQIVEDA